jgi:hypothetical protein
VCHNDEFLVSATFCHQSDALKKIHSAKNEDGEGALLFGIIRMDFFAFLLLATSVHKAPSSVGVVFVQCVIATVAQSSVYDKDASIIPSDMMDKGNGNAGISIIYCDSR